MEVRLATAKDAESIAGVHVRSWQVAYRGLIPDDTIDQLDLSERTARWSAILEASDQDVFVAVEDALIHGFCSLEPSRDEAHAETIGEISSLYVDPAHWRRGLGRALCTAAVAKAHLRGFHELVLWVLEDNHGARRFYEALGFVRDSGADLTRGFGGGVELAEIRYRRRLGVRAAHPRRPRVVR